VGWLQKYVVEGQSFFYHLGDHAGLNLILTGTCKTLDSHGLSVV
jgi:hypothetical protein